MAQEPLGKVLEEWFDLDQHHPAPQAGDHGGHGGLEEQEGRDNSRDGEPHLCTSRGRTAPLVSGEEFNFGAMMDLYKFSMFY